MKFRIDGLGFFAGGYCSSLEEARSIKHDPKKNRTGTITVEMEELEYISLINSYEVELNKNISEISGLRGENQKLKKHIETLQNTMLPPQVLEKFKNNAQQQINAEIEAREKIKKELTSQIEALIRREKGLRNALAKWQKKVTGEDSRPPKDIRQKGVRYELRRRALIKIYTLEKYLPFPFETDFNELEEYARVELVEGVKLKRIYINRGKWIAVYESTNPL